MTRAGLLKFRISIHALREEGDLMDVDSFKDNEISIHALREEGDGHCAGQPRRGGNFYPRPPRGGRRAMGARDYLPTYISIHALREESDKNPLDVV